MTPLQQALLNTAKKQIDTQVSKGNIRSDDRSKALQVLQMLKGYSNRKQTEQIEIIADIIKITSMTKEQDMYITYNVMEAMTTTSKEDEQMIIDHFTNRALSLGSDECARILEEELG